MQDQLLTSSQDSRPQNRVQTAKDQDCDKKLVNFGPRKTRRRFVWAFWPL